MGLKILTLVFILCSNAGYSSGRRSRDDKIHGGTVVNDIRVRPWVVNLQIRMADESAESSGGTLVTALYVITVCHSLFKRSVIDGKVKLELLQSDLKKWDFIAGSTIMRDLRNPDSINLTMHAQIRKPAAVHHHPECGKRTHALTGTIFGYDIGLAKMVEPFIITEFVKPAGMLLGRIAFNNDLKELAERQKRGQRPQCTVSGYGSGTYISIPDDFFSNRTKLSVKLDDGGQKMLRTASMVDITTDVEDCVKRIIDAFHNEAPMDDLPFFFQGLEKNLVDYICAWGEKRDDNSLNSPCAGDAGDGLICNGKDKKDRLLGAVSWRLGCGSTAPTAFQSLGPTIRWLNWKMCKVVDCQDVKELHRQCLNPREETFEKLCGNPSTRSSLVTTHMPHSFASKSQLCLWAMIPLLWSLEI